MPGLLLLVIALIVYGSLYPWQFDFARHIDPVRLLLHSWPNPIDRFVFRDIGINILLYVPLGAGAVLCFRPRRRASPLVIGATVLLGFLLSASMELLQAFDDHRTTSLLDLTTNTLGTLSGALLAVTLHSAARLRLPTGIRLRQSGIVLAACWAGFQFFPFFPIFSSYRVRAAASLLTHSGNANAVEIWIGAAEWMVLAVVLEALFGRIRTWWLAAVMLLLAGRIFIVTRTLTWNDLLAAAAALALWAAFPPRFRLPAAAALILSAILLRELVPFHLSATPQPFSWIPFVGTLESERQSAAVILLRKAFDYGAAVWVLHETGWPYARAGACIAAALFVLEWLQRYLPGRTPETTDAVIALLMALALSLIGPRQQRRI